MGNYAKNNCLEWSLLNKVPFALTSNEGIWFINGEKWELVPEYLKSAPLLFPKRGGFRCQTHPHLCRQYHATFTLHQVAGMPIDMRWAISKYGCKSEYIYIYSSALYKLLFVLAFSQVSSLLSSQNGVPNRRYRFEQYGTALFR